MEFSLYFLFIYAKENQTGINLRSNHQVLLKNQIIQQ